jgi:hypothetical protein
MRRQCAHSKINTTPKTTRGHQGGARGEVATIPLSILDKDESAVQSAHLRGRVEERAVKVSVNQVFALQVLQRAFECV